MSAKTPQRPKGGPKIDFDESYAEISTQAASRAETRFEAPVSRASRAAALVSDSPTAFGASETAPAPIRTRGEAGELPIFDPNNYTIGGVYRVPLGLLDGNTWGARVYYKAALVDRLITSFEKHDSNKQKVAANGFVKPDGRVELIDGGTRLRTANSTNAGFLDVKIEKPPASAREQFKRSKELNEERSEQTALDLAVQFRKLLDAKEYESQDALAADMGMTKSQVSMYLRIEAIPDRLRRIMVDDEQTSFLTIAYEISALFTQPDFAQRQDHYEEIGEDVIREVQAKKLGKQQVIALVRSKLEGPRSRERPEAVKVKYNEAEGTIKMFAARGQLDFSIRGLPPEQLDALAKSIKDLCAGQLPLGN